MTLFLTSLFSLFTFYSRFSTSRFNGIVRLYISRPVVERFSTHNIALGVHDKVED
jgi:serine kinase of HPr protein (carbohydrate metabolism regulator)